MKRCSSVWCVLLALAMTFSLAACGRGGVDDNGENESVEPTEDSETESIEPAEDSATISAVPSAGVENVRQDLIVMNREEYEARPHGIQEGTVFSYAVRYEVPSQLPWNCSSEGWLWGNVYEGLLYMYMNDPGDIRGCIAESWEHSDDYLTWTFHIRDGVTFTDGTVCDAYAIAEAWDYIYKVGPPYMTNNNIASWEAGSEKAFIVRLSAPCPWFEAALCGYTHLIVSPTALELYGMENNRAAVGTGPYDIESYKSGEGIVLKANPDYWLEEKIPCIETVDIRFMRDQAAVTDALLSGELDGASFVMTWYPYSGETIECYRKLQENGYDGNLIACFGNANPMWFNAKKVEDFQIREVREAICRFIGFKAMNDSLYGGLGCVQSGIWAEGSTGYVPTDQFYYDPEEGHALLASVGMEASDIYFHCSVLEEQEEIFKAIQAELARAGVEINIKQFGPITLSYPPFNGDWSVTFVDASGYRNCAPYAPWTYILKPDALIKLCWQDIYNPELYQEMLDEYGAMVTAATWDEMLAYCRQLTTYVQEDFGAIGGVQAPVFVALSKDFKNGVYFTENHDIQLYYLYE